MPSTLEIARVRDLAREPMPGEIRLQWWREALAGERAGEAAAHPVAAALGEALSRYRLPAERLIALIDAHAFDLYDEPMATLDDLDDYARDTQTLVLETAAAMLGGAGARGRGADPPCRDAYTVAGILSMLGRHAARRQLFVPLEVLDRHKLAPADIFAMESGASLQAALAELRRHARRQLAPRVRNWPRRRPKSCRRCCRSRPSAPRSIRWSGAAISRFNSSRRRGRPTMAAVARGAQADSDFQRVMFTRRRAPAPRPASARDRPARGR